MFKVIDSSVISLIIFFSLLLLALISSLWFVVAFFSIIVVIASFSTSPSSICAPGFVLSSFFSIFPEIGLLMLGHGVEEIIPIVLFRVSENFIS